MTYNLAITKTYSGAQGAHDNLLGLMASIGDELSNFTWNETNYDGERNGIYSITRKPANSTAEVTDEFYISLDSASVTLGTETWRLTDPISGSGDLPAITTRTGNMSGWAAKVGSTTNDYVFRLWVSNIDPRSWFLTLNGYCYAFDYGDNFYKYNPINIPGIRQFYTPFIASSSSGVSAGPSAWGVNDASNNLSVSTMSDLYMVSMVYRDDYEAQYVTDILLTGYKSSSDINVCIAGARPDIRSVVNPAGAQHFGTPMTTYFDGTDYWVGTGNAGGPIMNLGPTLPTNI